MVYNQNFVLTITAPLTLVAASVKQPQLQTSKIPDFVMQTVVCICHASPMFVRTNSTARLFMRTCENGCFAHHTRNFFSAVNPITRLTAKCFSLGIFEQGRSPVNRRTAYRACSIRISSVLFCHSLNIPHHFDYYPPPLLFFSPHDRPRGVGPCVMAFCHPSALLLNARLFTIK